MVLEKTPESPLDFQGNQISQELKITDKTIFSWRYCPLYKIYFLILLAILYYIGTPKNDYSAAILLVLNKSYIC